MSSERKTPSDDRKPMNHEVEREDPLGGAEQLLSRVIPSGVDRRTFLMRSAVIGATAVITGRPMSAEERTKRSTATPPPLSPDLDVVKKEKGPVMTTLDEFYKVGPGPSSSHTIGPMRITYDFYQRCTKLPADQLAKATALKVNLFGSLSATGKGHGTERAALAGLVGKEPATVDPAFLDSLRDKPDQSFPVKLGDKTLNVTLKDIVYDAAKGDFPHPNTMTCKLMAGDNVLLEQEYYSVGGGFIEWKGYTPPKKNPPKYPFSTMKELRQHAEKNKLTIAQVILANEMSIPGRSEEEVYAFVDKITGAMVAIVKSGLNAPEDDVLPGPIKLHSKARPSTSAPRTKSTSRTAGSARCRRTRWRGRRKTDAATSSSPRRREGPPESCRRSSTAWAKEGASCRRRRSARACLPRRRSGTCASTMRRCLPPRAAVRRRSVSRRQWLRR